MTMLPSSSIYTNLVAQTIGEGSNDVGKLCSSLKINPWSKWKPISYWSNSGIDNNILKNRCNGFIVDQIKTKADLDDIKNKKWHYEKPTGGSDAPYRLGDFRNYDHNATPFIWLGYKENSVRNLSYFEDELNLDLMRYDKIRNSGGMQLSDFDSGSYSSFQNVNMKDLHFGVYCRHDDATHAVFMNENSLSEEDSGRIKIPRSWLINNTPATASFIMCASGSNQFTLYGPTVTSDNPTGIAYAFPKGDLYKTTEYSGSTIILTAETTAPSLQPFAIEGISSTLNGTYTSGGIHNYIDSLDPYYQATSETGSGFQYFQTSNYGSIFFKCYFVKSAPQTNYQVVPSDLKIVFTGSFRGSSDIVEISGTNGHIYDHNFINQTNPFYENTGSYFYIGLDMALADDVGNLYYSIPITCYNQYSPGLRGNIHLQNG